MNHTLLIVLAGVAVLGLLSLLGGARRRAREAALYVEEAGRAVSLTGRVLLVAGVITAGEFAVIRYAHTSLLVTLAVLAVPALLAAVPLVRALTLTTPVDTHHRRYRR